MDNSKDLAVPVAHSLGDHGSGTTQVQNADELRLAQMGHKQELKRHFSIWGLIGMAANCTVSWTGLGLGLITSINAGGPGALIYGFILVFVLQCFLGTSLAEFVSAYPVEGGMYHWSAAIAPKRYSASLSFATGWSAVFGWIFTTASTNLIYAQNFMALIALYKTNLVVQPWMTFIVYQGFNIISCGIVMFGNKWMPAINNEVCYVQLAWFTILVTIAAAAPKHNDAEFVFQTWINKTGWENNVICFITGLVNPLYSLGGLDGITHITEEMPNPGQNAPLALACTLAIAFITGLSFLLSLMFSVQDYSSLSNSPTGLPIAELFRQATQSRGGAFSLVFLLCVAVGPSVIGSQLSTGRILWAFARDDGLPFSKFCSKVNPRFKTPINAQLCVGIVIALLGCIFLGSSTAFNSMMSSAVYAPHSPHTQHQQAEVPRFLTTDADCRTINNIAYLVPILTNVLLRRKTMHRGPFSLGFVAGMTVNGITVAWLVFAIVFFSFPYDRPVTVSNMNYTCVCVGGFLLLELMWWVVAGKKYSRGMQKVREEKEEENASRAMLVNDDDAGKS
ncbi:amino acid transporter [Aspergillus sclerotiicarbonarius CBS 121057]|uniref:Amino acid transporter n=1 Tax=Aspergillus sclerotiicarbonarius (strain CBS 121057 / IBT 28362) TaxID=1448318 RepID=A0A319EBJ7_ASPSB|nr:amino acid transporter [Aspergillus sclerotiicarbonarius CBS 121057]